MGEHAQKTKKNTTRKPYPQKRSPSIHTHTHTASLPSHPLTSRRRVHDKGHQRGDRVGAGQVIDQAPIQRARFLDDVVLVQQLFQGVGLAVQDGVQGGGRERRDAPKHCGGCVSLRGACGRKTTPRPAGIDSKGARLRPRGPGGGGGRDVGGRAPAMAGKGRGARRAGGVRRTGRRALLCWKARCACGAGRGGGRRGVDAADGAQRNKTAE